MATLRAIQNRIKSTGNIKKITKAMEAVSAVKMRRSEQVALQARPFALAGLEVLKKILHSPTIAHESFFSPLLKKHKNNSKCFVVITSDKGLAGSFNSNVLKKAVEIFSNEDVKIISIGKKATDFFTRKQMPIIKSFSGAGDYVNIEETDPISKFIEEEFNQGKFNSVSLIYTNFLSALKQEVMVRKLLPFNRHSLEEIVNDILPKRGRYANIPMAISEGETASVEYIFEPGINNIMDFLLRELMRVQIYHAILEANASEHSSRMIAMKNASESASELIDDLTMEFNKARQAKITSELIEITAGKEALNN